MLIPMSQSIKIKIMSTSIMFVSCHNPLFHLPDYSHAQATTNLPSETIDFFAFSRILYKWNHTCIILGLTCFTQHSYFEISLCCCMYQWVISFLLLSTLVCLDTQQCICHAPGIHLCCFLLFTITNKVAINIQVQVFVWT